MRCRGTARSHCCWLAGVECRHLVKTGDRIACGLYLDHGTWAAVYTDPRYLADVAPAFTRMGIAGGCGDWPPDGLICASCGGCDG